MAWTNEDTFRFIELYKNKPIIWNPRNKKHNDRNMVDEAWNRIADVLDIPVSVLKRKKKTLMTTFRFHYKKKQQTIRRCKMGLGKHIYTPIWTFYEPLEAFLKGVYESKSGKKIKVNKAALKLEPEEEANESSEEQKNDSSNDATDDKLDIPLLKRCSNYSLGVKQASKDVSSAFNVLNRIFKEKLRSNDYRNMDECELYGKLLAKKLRQFSENERQDIMYELDGLLLNRCVRNSLVSPPLQIIINENPNSASDSYVSPSLSPSHTTQEVNISNTSIKNSPKSPQSDPLQSSSSQQSSIPDVTKATTS